MTDHYQTNIQRPLLWTACVLLGCGLPLVIQPAVRADQGVDADAAAEFGRVIMMQRYIVLATRIEKNPWRYASLPGFEVLSRASDEATNWWLDALRRGLWLENQVMPKDWLSQSPMPYTVIIDDTNLETVPTGQLPAQPIIFRSPVDALTWGHLSERTKIWTDRFEAYDDDTYAINSNVYDVNTRAPAYSSISLERVFRCTPPLPRWLIAGLLAQDYGIFRESFMLEIDIDFHGDRLIRRAEGPGTLWVSLDETQQLLQQLKKDKKTKIMIPPLRGLFDEAPLSGESRPLWVSEAALFVRWGLMGPGHEDPVMSRAFLEFVRRARREPVTEQIFTDCFGFGYAAMEGKLESFLRAVLAQPNSVDLSFPAYFPEVDMKAATADQIGRILGDWLRMQGDSLRNKDPEMSERFLKAAGRMLLRAYRDDNGLPPDVDPAPLGERSAKPSQNAALGPAVVMKPFVVTADRIHDPGLLAVYGLYEHDTGNDGKAREFLEAAVKAGVARPKAYLVLAELRYAEATGKPLGSKGKLSAQQAASILAPLQTALRYPPAPDVYALIVETWVRCEAKPSGRDVEDIVEGVTLFPRNTRLAFRSALVCALSGYAAQAGELIDKGFVFATRESDREYFRRLRSTLVAPAIPEAK
jgi:hypothetical protein